MDEATDQRHVDREVGLLIDQGVQAIVERIRITARALAESQPIEAGLTTQAVLAGLGVGVGCYVCLLFGLMPDVKRQRT